LHSIFEAFNGRMLTWYFLASRPILSQKLTNWFRASVRVESVGYLTRPELPKTMDPDSGFFRAPEGHFSIPQHRVMHGFRSGNLKCSRRKSVAGNDRQLCRIKFGHFLPELFIDLPA